MPGVVFADDYIGGWYNQINIVSKFTYIISRNSGDKISCCNDIGSRSDGGSLAVMSSRDDW